MVLCDALQEFTGQAVLSFMQRLMDQAGEVEVDAELQRGVEGAEPQTWSLRHFAGHLLPQSEHAAAYRLEAPQLLRQTDLLGELRSPLAGLRADGEGDAGVPPARLLRLGGTGARSRLQRLAGAVGGGLWDCALLGRRKWRLFPPETSREALCAEPGSETSPADCFACGPDAVTVQSRFGAFAPAVCWECEQCMGDAVVVPTGWWYQTYDDDRTLSVAAGFGPAEAPRPPAAPPAKGDAEVIEFEFVD